MQEYSISIVTPFHNVRTEVFRSAVESMKKQTLGFENIEWIIVFHNCEQRYIDGAMELVRGMDNVRTEIIRNDVHTPSSPRNHGMRLITSRILGFLDADDSFTPWCMKEAVEHMQSSGAQIVWFRREYERENSNTIPMTEIVLWNQTYPEIIIDRDRNWDNEKLFSGVWGLVTSRIYDAAFLRENNVWFDEKAYFAEDYLFNLEAYGHVRRLCYLPQMIGYHYFINSESLVQKVEKTPSELIQYAIGFKQIFDTGLKYGFYMDAIMGGMFYTEMRFMMGTPSLTLADRIRIKEILEPYLEMMKPIRVSKLYSEKAVHERYYTVRDYLLHPEKWANGEDSDSLLPNDPSFQMQPVDMTVLREILERNVASDMGERYHFNDIITVRGFRAMVPVSNHETYRPLMALTSRIGESSVFVREPVRFYLRFLIGDDRLRMLPVTDSHLATYFDALDDAFRGQVTFPLFDQLFQRVSYNDNTSSCSVYAAVLQSYLEHRDPSAWNETSRLVMPGFILSDDGSAGYYVRVLYALAEEKLTQIFAPNTYSILRMMDFIRKNLAQLCDDLEHGTISGAEDAPSPAAGQAAIKANPERAAKIRKGAASFSGLQDIWPALTRITARYTDEFSFYTDLLSRYAEGIRFRAVDMIPEAMLGVAGDDGTFLLNTKGGFYELADAGAAKNAELILPAEAKEGRLYRLYVTNLAGLYRYDTERYIRVVRKAEDGAIRYLPYADFGRSLMTGGARLQPETLRDAACALCREQGVLALDYGYTCEAEEGLVLYLQPAAEGVISREDTPSLAAALDDILRRECAEYGVMRNMGSAPAPQVRILSEQTMYFFTETRAGRFLVAPDAVRPLHIAVQPEQVSFLRATEA